MIFESTSIIHETIDGYVPQLDGVAYKKNQILQEMVNVKLFYSCLSDGL